MQKKLLRAAKLISILPGLSHNDIENLIDQISWHHDFEFVKLWQQQNNDSHHAAIDGRNTASRESVGK